MWEQFGIAAGGACIALMTYIGAVLQERRRLRLERLRRSEPTLPLAITYHLDIEIHVLLSEMLNRWQAQRAYLSKFHDGDRYIDHSDILKKSRTHERVRPGTSYQAEFFRGMLVSTMTEEMALVLEEGASWRLLSDVPEGKFRWLCERGGVHAVARTAVKVRGKIVGFLGLDFEGANSASAPADIEDLCGYARRCGQLISQFSQPVTLAVPQWLHWPRWAHWPHALIRAKQAKPAKPAKVKAWV